MRQKKIDFVTMLKACGELTSRTRFSHVVTLFDSDPRWAALEDELEREELYEEYALSLERKEACRRPSSSSVLDPSLIWQVRALPRAQGGVRAARAAHAARRRLQSAAAPLGRLSSLAVWPVSTQRASSICP